jgi:pimeloyl-ACP methyl ester carboxylesterase
LGVDVTVPETRYAVTADGVHIAYQVFGDGSHDLLFCPGFVFNVEAVWRLWPKAWVDIFRRLATFSRVILFDRRGTGLSDRIVGGEQMSLEARMDDIRAVMDAVSSERAVLVGLEDGFGLCAMFSATYPERTTALVGMSATASGVERDGYPGGWSPQDLETELAMVERSWGSVELAVEWSKDVWPHETDPAWFRDYATWTRACVSPGDAMKLLRVDAETDVCDLLPTIGVPTLILHRVGDRVEPVAVARYLAERIPGATLVELPGDDHGWVARDQDRWIDEVERFAIRLRDEEADFDRVLKTVIFTDIVDSTSVAASLGDRAWKELLDRHHASVRSMLARYRGEEVDTAGDGFFAAFDGPARGVRCARAIVEAVQAYGIEIRAGVHTGEVETIDGKIGGIAVVIGARVGARAGASEVLVSSTVKDLTAGSGLTFEDAGEHELKGVPDRWRLFRVVP